MRGSGFTDNHGASVSVPGSQRDGRYVLGIQVEIARWSKTRKSAAALIVTRPENPRCTGYQTVREFCVTLLCAEEHG